SPPKLRPAHLWSMDPAAPGAPPAPLPVRGDGAGERVSRLGLPPVAVTTLDSLRSRSLPDLSRRLWRSIDGESATTSRLSEMLGNWQR
ncbi:MAG: hypothetical protein ACKOJF_13585, partial [Planctomycetaceae bacterium]